MYVQITTRCNMKCRHCCFSCTENGEDMSFETFKNCLEFDEYISIGGGEPTIHPLFWQFIAEGLANCEIWLSTNGSITNTSITLSKMAKKGILSCNLSRDEFHGKIDKRVIKAFGDLPKSFYDMDRFGKRTVFGKHNTNRTSIVKAGRGAKMRSGKFRYSTQCPCDDWFILPNGDVKQCGCEDSPILGNVNDPNFKFPYPNDDIDERRCYNETFVNKT